MSTSYERGLSLEGLTFDELMELKRARFAESASLQHRNAELRDQLDRIQDALSKVKKPDAP